MDRKDGECCIYFGMSKSVSSFKSFHFTSRFRMPGLPLPQEPFSPPFSSRPPMETVRVASPARGGSVEKLPRLCAATAVADDTLKRRHSDDADRKDDSTLHEIAAHNLARAR